MASTAQDTRLASRITPDRTPGSQPRQPLSGEASALAQISERLHPADCALLIRIIGHVAELERTRGEAAAMDMLETAIARLHGAVGRA